MAATTEDLVLAGVDETADLEAETSWWRRYSRSLEVSGLSQTAREVIEEDSRYILESGVHGCGPTSTTTWPASRQRSGVVMGAVQSGKTASMLGVAALALDSKVDVVVLLAGTRVALWRQTYERLLGQLWPTDNGLVMPRPIVVVAEDANFPIADWYQLPTARVRRALQERQPLILVVMKHGQHLAAAAKFLHSRVYTQAAHLGRPIEVLVLDDEADDGSILDAVVENALDPSQDSFKQIPRHIVDLWATRQGAPETALPNLFATYIAYTATPQANFLQADQNPLAPRDFAVALRTPGPIGDLTPRSTSYREPSGPTRYYTGGSTFYPADVLSAPFMVTEPATLQDCEQGLAISARRKWIADAVRAYLVAGAVRLLRDTKQRRLSGLRERTFSSVDEAKAACPPPHTMLFHPSSAVVDQFESAAELLAWARGIDLEQARTEIGDGERRFDPDVLRRDMEEQPGAWQEWLQSYRKSADYLATKYVLPKAEEVPALESWPEVERVLLQEVIPYVRLSIINSDAGADDRPRFEPLVTATGVQVPPDVFTVFVSGNIMARGLTLEGLTTTLFLRMTQDPAADTQMQMQRWFGYRGAFLDLCRVFLPESQLQLFSTYHDTDDALRRQLVDAMNSNGPAPKPLVLEGIDFRATGKIANIAKVPLSPGATPFVDIVNSGERADPNMRLFAATFAGASAEVSAAGTLRGRILAEPLSLLEAADLLNKLTYADFAPDPSSPTTARWDAISAQIGLADDADAALLPLFRSAEPVSEAETQGIPPSHCPYSIAAYFRLWHALLDRRAPGLFPTDDGSRRWSSLDLADKKATQPRFYVGVRFGSAPTLDRPADSELSELDFEIRPMTRAVENSVLKATWGSRNPGDGVGAYLGDQLFDYHFHDATLRPDPETAGPLWRPVGAPGLILFHVIAIEGRQHPVLAVGLAIPLGGPDHFASRPGR